MNTPAHAVVNLILLGKKERPKHNLPIVIGAILPDLPMVVFYFYQKVIKKIPESTIWSETYFEANWQHLFDVFNSLPFMLLGLALAKRYGVTALIPFCLSMILHVFEDLPLHHGDGHAHFFPFSDWRFDSPVSYWDPAHYGGIVAPIEAAIVLVGSIILFRTYLTLWTRILIGGVFSVYLSYLAYVFWMWA